MNVQPSQALTIENTYKYLGTNIGAIDNKNNTINDDITS